MSKGQTLYRCPGCLAIYTGAITSCDCGHPPSEPMYVGYAVFPDDKAQQEQLAQEPYCWYLSEHSEITDIEWNSQKPKDGYDWKPLYKTAPTRTALSDDTVKNLISESELLDMFEHIGWYSAPKNSFMKHCAALVRKVEAHCRGCAK